MGNKIFTISEDQYQHNIPLVREYIRNKEMYNRDFAKLCGVNNSTMQTILAGQFRGTINTWQKIKQTTKLDILQAFGLNCEFSEDEKGTKSIIKLREK